MQDYIRNDRSNNNQPWKYIIASQRTICRLVFPALGLGLGLGFTQQYIITASLFSPIIHKTRESWRTVSSEQHLCTFSFATHCGNRRTRGATCRVLTASCYLLRIRCIEPSGLSLQPFRTIAGAATRRSVVLPIMAQMRNSQQFRLSRVETGVEVRLQPTARFSVSLSALELCCVDINGIQV
jgi:hypothetical protein